MEQGRPAAEQPAFGELLRRYRLAAGLSQEALAERSRLSVRAISDLERGARRLPYRETVRQLATALDLSREDHAALLEAGRAAPRLRMLPGGAPRAEPGHTVLLATKLVPPPTRATLVDRRRLTKRIDLSVRGPLTLVSAPPGSGKTTLLSAWRASVPDSGTSVAWVSLDGGDNDPVRFWSHVLAALDRASPGVAVDALAMLQPAPHRPGFPPRAGDDMLVALVNRLVEVPTPLILVLDDYHEIVADEIHQGLAFLLDHVPPCLHLLLASRSDPPLPLAQLRARGAIVEIRAADLRFTPEEAADFLSKVMGLSLPAEAASTLQARTEGWIAGLQLAALSLQTRTDSTEIAPFIEAFTGSHRYVLDYLVDEVLRQQPEPVQRFLLRTSILERFCAPLCAAVVDEEEFEQPDRVRACQGLLEHLDRGNVFVVALDDTRTWYRYHQLFADALRQRLREDGGSPQVSALHERAAAWLEDHGVLSEAIGHALDAGAHERAAALLDRVALDVLLRGEVETLRRWLAALPDAVWQAWPRLCVVQALLVADLHTFDLVEQYVEMGERALQASPSRDTPDIRGEIAVTRVLLATLGGRPGQAIAHAQEALALLSPDNLLMRFVAYACLGAAYAGDGQLDLAIQTLDSCIEHAYAAGSIPLALMLAEDLTYFQRARGRLHQAAETCREALAWAEAAGVHTSVFATGVLRSLADLLCEWNDHEGAARHIDEALALPVSFGQISTQVLNLLVAARIRLAQGDPDGALAILREARAIAQPYVATATTASLLALLEGCEAQAHLARGDMRAATALLERPGPAIDPALLSMSSQLVIYSFDHGPIARIQVHIAQGRAAAAAGPLREALALLERERLDPAAQQLPWRQISIGILRALALDALGEGEEALVTLAEAVTLGAPEGYIRLFAQEGAPLASLLQRLRARRISTHAACRWFTWTPCWRRLSGSCSRRRSRRR